MTIPTTNVTLSAIQTEFGGTNPISLSEYYRGGAYVPLGTTSAYGTIPTSGTITMGVFRGVSKFTPVVHTYSTPTGSYVTETVPTGASNVTIEAWGGGGSGGDASIGGSGGGGSGAYVLKSIAVTGGNTFSYYVGAGATTNTSYGPGSAGQPAIITGTVSGGSVSMNAGGGGGGSATGPTQGTGGIASGGTTNTNGNGGAASNFGASCPNGGSGGNPAGGAGGLPGGGGGSGQGAGPPGGLGGNAQVKFSYT